MLSSHHLQEPKPPWVNLLAWESEGHFWVPGLTIRAVDAERMRSTRALFREFAAGLQFPDYFGRNWDALEECLVDLSWLPPGPYAIVIVQATELLTDAQPEEFTVFLRLIENVAAEWATPVRRAESWDRHAVAFHLVLQELPHRCEEVRARIRAAGTAVEDLELPDRP